MNLRGHDLNWLWEAIGLMTMSFHSVAFVKGMPEVVRSCLPRRVELSDWWQRHFLKTSQ
jgi:hypothetical protein